jgi:hypothetical protein
MRRRVGKWRRFSRRSRRDHLGCFKEGVVNNQILLPAAVLVLWTLVILLWVPLTRIPALKRVGINMGSRKGGRGQDLEGVIPDRVNWKAHNYAHLVEQPTLFYAVVGIVALAGTGDDPINVTLAWAYVGMRMVHSLIQTLWNYVPARFLAFLLSTLVLIALAIRALIAAAQA